MQNRAWADRQGGRLANRTERDRFPDFPWRTLPSWGVLPESQPLTPTLSDQRTCRRSFGLGRWCRRDDAIVAHAVRWTCVRQVTFSTRLYSRGFCILLLAFHPSV